MIALAPCYIHGGIFEFNPDTVVTVLIDPLTNSAIDVDPHPDGKGSERAVQCVICDPCMEKVNEKRRERGMPEVELARDRARRLGYPLDL